MFIRDSNKDYEKDYEDKVRRFYLYRDMDTIDGKLYAEMFYRNEYVYSVTLDRKSVV